MNDKPKPPPEAHRLEEELTDLDPFENQATAEISIKQAGLHPPPEDRLDAAGGRDPVVDSWDQLFGSADPLDLVAADLGASTSDARLRVASEAFARTSDPQSLLIGREATRARWPSDDHPAPKLVLPAREVSSQGADEDTHEVRLPADSADAYSTSLWLRKAPQLQTRAQGDKPVIAERYEVIDPLGSGGMGRVLRVRHIHMGKEFALKIIHTQLLSDSRTQQYFFDEAKVASAMDHPNIVQMTDFGVDPERGAYIVMEMLKGETLLNRLETQKKLRLDQALEVTLQVAEALHYMHQQEFIHCDIKPENVFLCRTPTAGRRRGIQVKLIDFGLTRMQADATTLAEGEVAGTPQYMAPELIHRVAPTPVMDIYSLGVLLYEMVTGELPFNGTTKEILTKKVLDEAPAPSDQMSRPLDLFIEGFIVKALAKNPANRQQSMGDVIFQLSTFMEMQGFDKPRWRSANTTAGGHGMTTIGTPPGAPGPGPTATGKEPPSNPSSTQVESMTISEKREDRLYRRQVSAIFEWCPLPLFLLDRDGVLLRANAALANFMNTSRRDMLGARLEDTRLQHVYNDFREEWDEWVQQKDPPPLTRFLVLPGKEGKPNVHAMFVLVPRMDEAGKVKEVVGTIHSLGRDAPPKP